MQIVYKLVLDPGIVRTLLLTFAFPDFFMKRLLPGGGAVD